MSTTLTPRRTRPTWVLAIGAVIAIVGGAALVTLDLRSSTTDETFSLDPGASVLMVEVDRGHVLLMAGTGDRLQVRRTVSTGRRAPVVAERADADGASLTSRCPALSGRACSIRYEIAVPSGYVINLDANTARVEVHGLSVDKLQIEGSSGATHLEDVQGFVEVVTASGSVTGTRLGLREFVTRTASGCASLDFASAPERVTAATASGAVMIRLPAGEGPYRVAAHSGSGREEVQVPTDPASSRHVDVSSSSGDVAVLPR